MLLPLLVWIFAVPVEPVMETVLPALAYGRACVSTIQLQNLGETRVMVELEGHRGTGALAALVGLPVRVVSLKPGERGVYKLSIEDEDPNAWVKIRERLKSPHTSPAVAVSGATVCQDGTAPHSATRQIAYASRNPWFAGEISEMPGAVLTLVNLSATPAQVSLCYSSGTLIGMPDGSAAGRELRALCSSTQEVQVPGYGTRQFPVDRDGNSYFALRTRGESLVLQMLRPAAEAPNLFRVDSSVQFGGIVQNGR
jgi:hypothetical protein